LSFNISLKIILHLKEGKIIIFVKEDIINEYFKYYFMKRITFLGIVTATVLFSSCDQRPAETLDTVESPAETASEGG
jgi:hypothetical protein